MGAAGQIAAEPTLADILRDFWRAKFLLLAGAAAGLLAGFVFLQFCVPQYRAEMLVAPARHAPVPDLENVAPGEAADPAVQFVLQSLGTEDSPDFARFEAILREPSVAALLLQDADIKRGLSRARRWTFMAPPRLDDPARLSAWLQDNLEIEPVGATHLRRVVFRHPDPVFAALMLRALYEKADNLIRGELEQKTAQRVQYLDRMLAQTENPDHRRAITRLLMDQEQVAMILAVHEPFAAALDEPPASGARPDWPRRPVLIPVFMLVGLLLGYALHGLRRR